MVFGSQGVLCFRVKGLRFWGYGVLGFKVNGVSGFGSVSYTHLTLPTIA